MKSCDVPRAKLVDYLLKLEHPDGGSKARFFIDGGFSPDRPEELRDALRLHYQNAIAPEVKLDKLGCVRIVVTGPMAVPDGRAPVVVSVWKIDEPGQLPRLITAYPGN